MLSMSILVSNIIDVHDVFTKCQVQCNSYDLKLRFVKTSENIKIVVNINKNMFFFRKNAVGFAIYVNDSHILNHKLTEKINQLGCVIYTVIHRYLFAVVRVM
jgi:hypothetical protein